MSQLKKTALKMGALGLVLWGGYTWVNKTPENAVAAEAVVETTLDKTDLALDKSGEWVDEKVTIVADAWDRVDLKGKVSNAQDSVKPMGKVIKNTVNPNNIPGVKEAGWLDSKTSFPAMLLLLVASVVLSLLALSSPGSLTRGR